MDLMSNMIRATEGLKDNPEIVKRLQSIFSGKDIPTAVILAVLNNIRLFKRYARQDVFGKYLDPIEAAKYADPNDLLIYFADIQLYALVKSARDFSAFQSSAADDLEDGEIDGLSVKQIIFSYQRQKLVFAVQDNSSDAIKRICSLAEKCLHTTTSTIISGQDTEITVNNMCNDYEHTRKLFDELYSCVLSSMPELSHGIRMLPVMIDTTRDEKYKRHTMPNVSDIIINGKEWVDCLKYTPANFKIDINVTNNIGNIYNNCNFNGLDKKDLASEWVKNNPPKEKEITTDYYKRYSDANEKRVADNQFGKCVREKGYNIVRGSNGRYWVK